VNTYLLPLAIPLLLFSADLQRVLRDTGSLLPIFLTGSVATVLSTLIALAILPLSSLGENGWKIAAALCARHIGGAINYVAVTVGLEASQDAVSAGLAADNLICGLYFSTLYALARKIPAEQADAPAARDSAASASDDDSAAVRVRLCQHLPPDWLPASWPDATWWQLLAEVACTRFATTMPGQSFRALSSFKSVCARFRRRRISQSLCCMA
jgi:hypothetical protein